MHPLGLYERDPELLARLHIQRLADLAQHPREGHKDERRLARAPQLQQLPWRLVRLCMRRLGSLSCVLASF
jgi:hypothetical protein